MKKLLIISLFIPIALALAHSGVVITQSNPGKISLSVSLPQLQVKTEAAEGGNFTQLYFDGADRSAEVGEPQLPVIRELVEIPFDASVEVNAAVLNSEYVNLAKPVLPLQPPIPKSGPTPEWTINQAVYQKDEYLQKVRARIEMIGEIRGHRVALLEIYPVWYNPKQNLAEYASEMTIEMNLTGSNMARTEMMHRSFYSMPYEMMLSNLVKNYDAFILTPPPDLPIGYLIIVPDEWQSNIMPLAEWRTRKGFEVFVRTVSQAGGSGSTAIRNYITQAYNTWPIRPTFVLLVGDIDKIGYFTGSGTGNPPTDLNYSMMTTPDYFPDIDVSRASVANAAQLDSLVLKTIKYEKNQWMSGTDWTKKALFIASADGSYHGVAEGTHRYCMAKVRSYGVIADSIFTYYQTGAAAMVTTRINEGRAWVTFSGHGSETGWADPGISYPTSTVHALTNVDKVPLVGSYCCLSGNFAYSQECFSESWIRSGLRGAIANYASSVTSYWTEDDTLQRRVFDYAFDSNYVWAMGMLNKAKIRYYAQMGNTGMTRRYFEMYNMMGDGAIDVYWDYPAAITVTYPAVIPLGTYTIPVTVTRSGSPVRNALVCAMVKNDTSRRAVAYTNVSGQASLQLTTISPDSVYITVTGHNLAPHLGGLMALASGGPYVMYMRHQIFDPTPGGNNNGVVNPGEAIEMRVWIKNFGSSTANNVRAWLRTTDSHITITDSFKNLGNIAANDSAYTTDGFNFTVAASCTNNYSLQFTLTMKDSQDSTWVSNISIPVAQCVLEHVSTLVDDATGNNNGIINRGETVNLISTIRNIGSANAENVTSVLSSTTPGIQVLDTNGNFGTIIPTNTASNTADPYTIRADSSIVPGTIAQFRIVVTAGVYIDTLYFSLPIEIYLCDFEATNGGYEPSPATGGWEWGVPTSGPGNAHSGTKLWATGLGGIYPNNANWKLTSVQFTATANNPTLRFWHWYQFETNWDGGNVKLSLNGTNWTLVSPVGGYPGYISSLGESCYTGTTTGNFWQEATFNLPVNAGQQFYIRWHFVTDASVGYAGWYIDDVTGIGFASIPPANNDVGVEAVIAPTAIQRVNVAVQPVARVKNYGLLSQMNFPVVCSIFGAGHTLRYSNTQTVASIAASDTTRVTFDPWIPTATELCTVKIRTNLTGDQNPLNDLATRTTQISMMFLSEGFNDATFPPASWQAVIISGTYNWERFTTGTYPTCLPYEGDAMAGYKSWYASNGNGARLISPAISVSGATPCSLKFWMMHDPGYATVQESIIIETSTNGTTFDRVAAFRRYAATQAWTEHTVYLGSFTSNFYLAFRALSGYGNNMYIDDVRIVSGLPGVEQYYGDRVIVTALYAPKPNPVTNGLAHISFGIAEPSRVALKIYDASGRVIKTLVNRQVARGMYNMTWNGRDDNNRAVAEGIYFYTLETPKQNFTKKMVFTR